MKRLTSIALAGVTAASMVVPAFATPPTPVSGMEVGIGTTNTVVSSSVNIPSISVVVPLSDTVILNPFELNYTVPGTTTAKTTQIVHGTQYIQNLSDATIKVGYVATVTVPEDISYVPDPASETSIKTLTEGGKQLCLTLSTEPVKDSGAALTAAKKTAVITQNAADFLPDGSSPTYKAIVQPAATDNATNNQFLAYEIGGYTSKDPSWGVEDTVNVNIAWTFGF